VAVNGKGEITDRWLGFDGVEAWVASVEKARSDTRTIAAKKEAFAKEPNGALAECLANDAACVMDYKTAVKYFRTARDLDPSRAAYCSDQILSNMFYGSRDSVFTFDEVASEADLALAAPGATVDQIESLAAMMSSLAQSMEIPERAAPYLKAALDQDIGDAEPSPTRQGLMVEHALLVDHDAGKAVKLRKSMLPEDWQQDAGQLNSFAWWCFQNEINLDEAQKLAMQGVDLARDDEARASILDTAAEISAARGQLADAVGFAQRAADLAPDKDYYKEQLQKFTAAAETQ